MISTLSAISRGTLQALVGTVISLRQQIHPPENFFNKPQMKYIEYPTIALSFVGVDISGTERS